MQIDYYEILWVSKTASFEEIKKAYRKQAMEHHPDRHNWNKEKENHFKKINEAYTILSDENKRSHYDRFGSTEWMWWFDNMWFDINFDIQDIFDSFFWWWFNTNKKHKSESWEDLELEISLSFSEAIFWIKKSIKFNKKFICDECGWSWCQKWEYPRTCSTCNWSWYIRKRTQSIFWYTERSSVCPNCNWNWVIIEKKCHKCNSEKRYTKKQEKEIDIPSWINDWMTLKIKHEWNEWTNWKNGDLYISFNVPKNFEWLKRDEDNLYYDLDIDPVEAILWLNKKIKLPILGERTINIKSWTQHWEIIKLKWDWVKNINHDFKGDLFITLNIKIPTHLSKTEKEFYYKIAQEKNINHWKWFLFDIF